MKRINTTELHCHMGWLLILMLLLPGRCAADGDSKQLLSLAERLVLKAKELERVQVSDAIAMMLTREAEVTGVSTPAELAHFYNKLAELNATSGRVADTKNYAEKGLSLYSNDSDPVVADLYYNLSVAYSMRADFVAARKYIDQGLAIALKSGDRLTEGRGKLYIAGLYTQQQDNESALSRMKEVYAIALEVDDDELSWEVFSELGLIYTYIDDFEQSITLSLQAAAVADKLGMNELKISNLYNVAGAYIELKAYEKAYDYFNQMLELSRESAEKSNMHTAYKGFAITSVETKQHERALAYIIKAEEYLPFVEGVLYHVDHHLLKAQILSELDQTTKALEEVSIAEQKLPKDQLNNSTGFGLSILRYKSQFFGELGQYQKAYEIGKEYIEGYIENRTVEKDQSVSKLRVAFDVERNENLNKILEKDNEIKALQLKQSKNEQQIQTFLLIGLTILSLGLIFVMYRQLHARRHFKIVAQTDSLTNLFNRKYALAKGTAMMEEQLKSRPDETLAAEGKAAERKVSVMVFDLDEFKSINDNYGHSAGDQVLKSVAAVSKNCLRDTDVMARMGGEEFLVILPGVVLETAQLIAERLRQRLADQPQQSEQNRFNVTASFGIATAVDKETFEALIQRADKAMHQAKANGRNCVEVA